MSEKSYLEMSDEEILAAGVPDAAAVAAVVAEPAEDEPVAAATAAVVGPEAEGDVAPGTEAAADTDDAEELAAQAELAADAKPAAGKAAAEDAGADDKTKTPEARADEVVIDYKAEYERLVAPFKANGKDMSVGSVDDAIALMQMGANYNKKMAGLKPNLKLLKQLENNGLLSEEKIGFLIDLSRKDPAAISKLVTEAGIDPMEIDAEKAKGYQRTNHAVDDREIDLDTVLDEIQGTDTYTRTLDIVGSKWDSNSKQTVANAPQLLKVINSHIASGVYDLIAAEVERERVFGRLAGISDIEAYRQVGDAMNARGSFDHLSKPSGTQAKAALAQAVVVAPKPKAEDEALKDKRRAAGSTKPAAPGAKKQEFNPLSLSDAEFSKLGIDKFI